MVAVLIYAGVRRDELLWLTHDDVDFKIGASGMLHIRAKTIDGRFWQDQLLTSRLSLATAEFDQTVFYLDLLRATGELSSADIARTAGPGAQRESRPTGAASKRNAPQPKLYWYFEGSQSRGSNARPGARSARLASCCPHPGASDFTISGTPRGLTAC